MSKRISRSISKSIICSLLTISLLASLAGCSSSNGGESSAGISSGDEASAAASKDNTPAEDVSSTGGESGSYEDIPKPESINWASHDGLQPENGQEEWDAEFERLTGIKLEHEFISNNEYNSKLELYYAADTVPDVFDLGAAYYPKYVSENAVADLTDLTKESGLYDRIDESLWEQCTLGGYIYGVPREIPSACGSYIRKDWLDRLGMEVPATYDEFTAMLTGFRDEIDECLVPYTAPGLVSAQMMPEFYQGAAAEIVLVDGVWVDGMQQPNMEIALQNMQDAYKEGLLDLEAITNTTATCRDGWQAGTTGVFCYWTGNWGQQLTENLQKNVPDAEVLCIPPIEGAVYQYSTISVHSINGRLSDEKTAQVYKYFLDYLHDGSQGQVLFEIGVEGLHWEQDGKNVKMLPSLSDPEVVLNKTYILPTSRVTPLDLDDKNMDYVEAYTKSLEVTEASAKEKDFQPISQTYNAITSELTNLRDSTVAEIVTGNMSVQEGLAKYAEGAEALNMDKALEEMNANS